MKHYLVTYKSQAEGYFASREMEIIEAQSDTQAYVNASHKAKCSKWQLVRVELLAADQVALERKRLKDRRKGRYQSQSR